MNYDALQDAIEMAERFLRTCRKVRTEVGKYGIYKEQLYVVNNTKETAACKRASLDLTRALSELRK